MFCFDYEGAPGIRTANQGRQLKLEDLRPETTLRGIVAGGAVTGRYQQAELAADLWQVKLGEGSDEYPNPREFLRRTFLTEKSESATGGRGWRRPPSPSGA